MPLDYEVTVLRVDSSGRLYWRSTLAVNDAILTLLRFARKNPNARCRLELRESGTDVGSTDIENDRAAGHARPPELNRETALGGTSSISDPS